MLFNSFLQTSQPAITCSKLTECLASCLNMNTCLTPCSSVFIVNSEKENARWDMGLLGKK